MAEPPFPKMSTLPGSHPWYFCKVSKYYLQSQPTKMVSLDLAMSSGAPGWLLLPPPLYPLRDKTLSDLRQNMFCPHWGLSLADQGTDRADSLWLQARVPAPAYLIPWCPPGPELRVAVSLPHPVASQSSGRSPVLTRLQCSATE